MGGASGLETFRKWWQRHRIMAIAEDVQKLCKALGNADELQGGPEGGTAGASQAATFTVLQGIRKLADDSKRREP